MASFVLLLLTAALRSTGRVRLTSVLPLLENSRHGALVDLLTPHANDSGVHLSGRCLVVHVVQQVQTSPLESQQLILRGLKTSSQSCAALRDM